MAWLYALQRKTDEAIEDFLLFRYINNMTREGYRSLFDYELRSMWRAYRLLNRIDCSSVVKSSVVKLQQK